MSSISTYIYAFLVGGFLCLIGQILIDKTKLTPARILVIYVVTGTILGGLGLYKPLVDKAGIGATLPLTGFGYALSKGTAKSISEDGFLGIFTGGMTGTSGGITLAIFLAFFIALLFKARPKS